MLRAWLENNFWAPFQTYNSAQYPNLPKVFEVGNIVVGSARIPDKEVKCGFKLEVYKPVELHSVDEGEEVCVLLDLHKIRVRA